MFMLYYVSSYLNWLLSVFLKHSPKCPRGRGVCRRKYSIPLSLTLLLYYTVVEKKKKDLHLKGSPAVCFPLFHCLYQS